MEAAIGTASGLIGSVVNQLTNEFVDAYVASSQLALNSNKIKDDLLFTQGLLHEAHRRGVIDNPGLQGLLRRLSTKADEAENMLDELHYFIIRDQLDGTQYAVPDLGDDLRGHARHGRHALRYTVGNCLACFSCSNVMQDDDVAAGTTNPHNANNLHSGGNDGLADNLPFDRVSMSRKIKSVIEEMHSLCESVSRLLSIVPHNSSSTAIMNLKRPLIGSTTAQDTLYGRRAIFEQIVHDIIKATNSSETLYVLPVVGPGGIGKTTLTQHLYNDKRLEEHFDVRIWVCVSTDFDVLKLTRQIHNCILTLQKVESVIAYQITDLDQLQISIAQRLKSEKFLVVLDDIWECSSESWKNLLTPFMKGEAKGNMVLVTTRFPSIAEVVKTTHPITLEGLEPADFFTFFEACIFDGEKHEDYQHELIGVAENIAKKLKGSPLAAKTVGRLLKKEICWEHWNGVLENNEWQNQKTDDDIMPSLKISYDYLPFYLKKCFPYFALFPEDYRFDNLEITYFWIAIGVIDKYMNFMEELVDNGFLVKEKVHFKKQYYVLHDLLHELSRSISSQECLNIYSSVSFRADVIPKSIRHVSITMEDRYAGNFREEMVKLRNKIDIVNLRALMIFREYGETIDDIFKDAFEQVEGLRVLFIEVKSQEAWPHNFSKLIHLRCLKIARSRGLLEMTLPSTIARFYHLILLDLNCWHGSTNLPKDISRLINLQHLFYGNYDLHSTVPKVGRMKCLKELKKFCVKKESVGFELSELGELTELEGEVTIYNLERVETKEEAMKAKLMSKGNLKDLWLVWKEEVVLNDTRESSNVLDGLQPHPNLRALGIKNHVGSTGPSWLCGDTCIEMLKSLHLEGVSWVTLPPFGKLPHLTSLTLRKIYKVSEIRPGFGRSTDRSFVQMKVIVLDHLPELIEWFGTGYAHSFSRLEKISCSSCPNLCALPFLQDCSDVSYIPLREVVIHDCPKLLIPPMPHTSTLTKVDVSASPAGRMMYSCGLARNNRARKVERITFRAGSKIPWTNLQKLTSLRELEIEGDSSLQSMALLSSLESLTSLRLVDCKNIIVDGFNPFVTNINLKVLEVYNMEDGPRSVAADLLSELVVASKTKQLLPGTGCFQLKTLEVDSISAVLAAPFCTLFAATLKSVFINYDRRVESFTEEEEGALQLLTSLEELSFENCPGLPSLPRGLHRLSSLRNLLVVDCPEIRSFPKEGLPASLRQLGVYGCLEIRSLPVIPTSLRDLALSRCNPELREQAKKLQGTHPDLQVAHELDEEKKPENYEDQGYTQSMDLERMEPSI